MERTESRLPRARAEGLTSEALRDELLVYDLERNRCHALNRTAALVWRSCDGQTTVAEMSHSLHKELSLPADEGLVWLALDRLQKAHLLEGSRARPGDGVRATRRAAIRKLVLAAGLTALIPVVTSIVAPTPAYALSGPCGGSCITSAECAGLTCAPPTFCFCSGGTCLCGLA